MVEILKQDQYTPLPVAKQVMIIYAGVQGHLDDVPVNAIRPFESGFYAFMDNYHRDVERRIEKEGALTDEVAGMLVKALGQFKAEFLTRSR
jgi:F-type H+-transporting ATPase subunit alpha